MVKYDKLIVSDTDVLIRNDMDELFEREALAAV
jgi:lipopolysaccharide biosynthesis glycosyltransferase